MFILIMAHFVISLAHKIGAIFKLEILINACHMTVKHALISIKDIM
jgi:hypothetical protein